MKRAGRHLIFRTSTNQNRMQACMTKFAGFKKRMAARFRVKNLKNGCDEKDEIAL